MIYFIFSGMNQANAIIDLATEWGCVENIIGGCCDTASANLGKNNGAIPIMENRLGHPLLKFECQRHVRELHVKFYGISISGRESKGVGDKLFTEIRNKWDNSVYRTMDEWDK